MVDDPPAESNRRQSPTRRRATNLRPRSLRLRSLRQNPRNRRARAEGRCRRAPIRCAPSVASTHEPQSAQWLRRQPRGPLHAAAVGDVEPRKTRSIRPPTGAARTVRDIRNAARQRGVVRRHLRQFRDASRGERRGGGAAVVGRSCGAVDPDVCVGAGDARLTSSGSTSLRDQGSSVAPINARSISRAASRPSLIARTTSD